MQRKTFLVTALAALLCVGVALASTATIDPSAELAVQRAAAQRIDQYRYDAAWSYWQAQRALQRVRTVKGKDVNPITVLHTFVDLDTDLGAQTIDADIAVSIQAREDGVTEAEFTVDALDDFAVTDDEGNDLPYINSGYGTVVVTLAETLNEGEGVVLHFHNAGTPNCAPDPYFGMTFCAVTEEIVFFAFTDWLPTKAAYTLEDYYTGGTMDIDIHTPPDYVATTTSDPNGVEDLGDELIHHFVGHFGLTYIGLAFAQFEVFAGATESGKPVKAYLHSGDNSYAQQWADIGADILDYFTGVYTPYLYNKQDLIQTIDALGGGVGPQSATFYYATAFNTDPAQFYSESIYSHELAHSWWGNMIIDGDQYSPWLSEGFAEYSSRLYGYTMWDEYYQNYLYEVYFRYFQQWVPPEEEVAMTGEDIFTDDPMIYQAITYWKGAHVLRTLQWLLGDEAFFAGMHDYADSNVWETTGNLVVVDDFQATMEEASGEDLTAFFDAYVYTIGYPTYRWAAEFGQTADGYTVRVRVTQTNATWTLALPLEVVIWVGDEPDPRHYVVTLTDGVADETFVVEAEPRGAAVDNSWWLWADKIPELVGDVDSSNEVDGIDLLYVAWCQGGDLDNYDAYNYIFDADFNGDGRIDETDLKALLDNFGQKGEIHD
jgi:aminopeptidase N